MWSATKKLVTRALAAATFGTDSPDSQPHPSVGYDS